MKKLRSIAVLAAAAFMLTPLFLTTNAQASTEDEFPLRLTNTTNQTQVNKNVSTYNISDITRNEHFDKNNLSYYITPGTAIGVQRDIRAGALTWNMATKVKFTETKTKNSADIVFTNNGTTSAENGLTTNTINRSRGYIEVLSSKIDLSKNTIPQTTLSTMGKRVVEHELGHALGLKDSYSDQNGTIMWYKTPNTDVTPKDVQAINVYYK
ncbi:matrixin family metalloprotease [Companilactobacillus sp.]|jgi:hypothetical protein|uniref:matrixin family metalloprotease n=1 Tax=Companilactobacillus sp. TaxID=2767905 RepID=UPI0025B9DF01|nr:matrixin family metalloprotease [Companilactobacillus sp.]MCH4009125.1 hypothetical protein [Companilactobacillus sp.]MCH4050696.1 hypothetical protein [Companilactobacillus sp.]MCH4077067.1 hypothetical protein [Companilactobacillus sp.]MCH4125643.1 hypothetical protein [Companilactobacillus sp.]MCI1311352.1 hypothetical protein [Companilactobacillus sp.]